MRFSLLLLLLAYVVGSLPFGLWVGKLKGLDIREGGSGNIGATNAARLLGFRTGFLVFLLDFGKGAVPTLIGASLLEVAWQPLCVGGAAILGHVFPFTLGFKGGKGVATGAGVLAALAPVAFGVAFGAWVLVFALFRYVSLASLVGALLLPIVRVGRMGIEPVGCFAAAIALLILIRHRGNILRLLRGTERRFGEKKPEMPEPDVRNTPPS